MALSATKRAAHEGGGFREINVTPLVDVMLVLLIVFMVSTPLVASGLQVDLPAVSGEAATPSDPPVVLSVTADERVLLGEEDVTLTVERALRESARVQGEHRLDIQADKRAHYEVVARAMAAARAAGVTSLNLLVEPEAK